MESKSKFIQIFARIILLIGIAVGIIFTAVGSTMIINAGLKLAFFDEPRYFSLNRRVDLCENNGPKLSAVVAEEEKTPEEIEECKLTAEEDAKQEFSRDQGENIINGVSTLFVGLVLWLAFGIWGRRMGKNNMPVPPKPHESHSEPPHHS